MKVRNTVFIVFFLWATNTHLAQGSTNQPSDSLALIYYQEADSLLLFNRYDSARKYLLLAEEYYGNFENWEGYVNTKNKLSEYYAALFELKKAENEARAALKLAREHLGENTPQEAEALSNIGNVHYLTGQHNQALENFQAALAITEKLDEEESEFRYSAPANLGLGNVFYGKYEYADAFVYFNNALEKNRELLGDDHPYVANSYLSLGNLYRNKGSYIRAQENYEIALEINKNYFGENHPDVANAYVGLGDVYQNNGAYDIAMQYYKEALIIYSQFLNPKDPKFGQVWLGMADVYKNQENFPLAMEYYHKALENYKNSIGEVHQNTIQCYLGIGNTYMYQEKFIEALEYYNDVLEINYFLVGENHVNTSAAYNNLGSIYYFAGQFNNSIKFFEKALAIDVNIHGTDHPNVANAFYNLARVNGEIGKTVLALEYVQQAINSSIIDFEDQNFFVNPALANFFDTKDLLWYLRFKGEMLEAGFKEAANMKGLDIALHSFILSDSLVEQVRQSYTDRKDQIELGKLADKIYESAVRSSYSLLELLDESNVTQIDQDAVLAEKIKEYQNNYFFFTERNKGAVLFSSIAEANAKSFGGLPDSVLALELELKVAIQQYTQELAANPDSTLQAKYQQLLFNANRDYENLIARMEAEYPKYYELKYDVEVASVEEIQEFLSDSTMMISYFVTDDLIYANYITKDDFQIHRTRKSGRFDDWIKGYRNSLVYQLDEAYWEIAPKLYEQLFPGEIPEEVNRLLIVQDGVMSTVPFEALPTENIEDHYALGYKEYPYLIKDYAVSYTYSANLLHRIFQNESTVQEKAPVASAIMAPVEFDGHQLQILRSIRHETKNEPIALPNAREVAQAGTLPPLPGTKEEVEQISKYFMDSQQETNLMLYDSVQEDFAEQGHWADYNYLHIASHGFVNQEEPEFSGIFLAAPHANSKADGVLFSGEIYSLALNAEMVTLSACETGLGKVSRGEGLLGLSRALIYAGAKNLTVSLWKVSDTSTRDLMIAYYKQFAGEQVPEDRFESLDYADYLRKAKLELIGTDEFAHPYYWSPFVLIGK
ncbi:MAG: CHAT domain-containing tetratricopeptide repeat protein [Bacteroidota bacterium]